MSYNAAYRPMHTTDNIDNEINVTPQEIVDRIEYKLLESMAERINTLGKPVLEVVLEEMNSRRIYLTNI